MELVATKMTTIAKQLDMFGRAIESSPVERMSFAAVNFIAAKKGYLIAEELCTAEVLHWLDMKPIDYNSTFYKEWSDVISKSRFDLFIDQMMHYASTYGTDYTGEPYIPNTGSDTPDFTKLKVIAPITKEELFGKCSTMLYSGIALKEDTIVDILAILKDIGCDIELGRVRNKEAKMHLYKMLNLVPDSAEEMVRYLVFLCTDKTMVIKDKATFTAIRASRVEVTDKINLFGIEKLAAVFYRYKTLFIAMRNSKSNKVCINRLRKLAKTHHEPHTGGFFERILQDPSLLAGLPQMLSKLNNFKKITLLQTINIRAKELSIRPFVVRNQKLYMKEEKTTTKDYYADVYVAIYNSLIESLKAKACKVKLSDVVNLTLPTSEKSFIGNLPLGTQFLIGEEDAIVGINWRAVDGANDIDLKYIDIDGGQVGWNASYYDSGKNVVYSGDLTSANPEATELLYASKGFKPGIVKVNLFNGAPDSKFTVFVAKEKITSMQRGYMVDPNHILFQTQLALTSKEMSLGIITEGKFTLASFRTGSKRVAGDSITNKYTEYVLKTMDCYLDMRTVLTDAGFTITNEDYELDLSNPDKSALINLLS